MTIQEAYLRSLQKNEQNLANGGIKLDQEVRAFVQRGSG